MLIVTLSACLAASGAEPAVTSTNLLERERYWPYRVTLTEAWSPEGRDELLRAGSVGVLIRVEPGGVARIDFSAEGKLEVPVERTDLVDNANRIRRGELAKGLPNFVHAIGTRLVDAAAPALRALPPEASADRPGFLCVFADPSDEGFASLVEALAPLRDRHDVATLLFPQGEHPDAGMRERLRSLDWRVPFVYDFLSEPYTRTLLDEGTPLPAVLLQTAEGRRVFQGDLSPELVPRLRASLDAEFGASSSLAGSAAQAGR